MARSLVSPIPTFSNARFVFHATAMYRIRGVIHHTTAVQQFVNKKTARHRRVTAFTRVCGNELQFFAMFETKFENSGRKVKGRISDVGFASAEVVMFEVAFELLRPRVDPLVWTDAAIQQSGCGR